MRMANSWIFGATAEDRNILHVMTKQTACRNIDPLAPAAPSMSIQVSTMTHFQLQFR